MSRPRDRSPFWVPRSRESPGSGDALSPAWWRAWVRRKGSHGRQRTCPSARRYRDLTSHRRERRGCPAGLCADPPVLARPALSDQGYYVGRVERHLYWVTDGTYQAAFLTTPDGVVLFDAPDHRPQPAAAVDEIATAEGVSNKVTHLVYSHHHDDHAGASSLFDGNVVRIAMRRPGGCCCATTTRPARRRR